MAEKLPSIVKYIRNNNEKIAWYFDFSKNEEKNIHILIHLLGKGSSVGIYGIYKGVGKMKQNISITIFHEADETKSRVYLRAALDDSAQVTFSGKINVKKSIKNADTHVEAKALLLSDKSSAFIEPDLEINTNQIQASHGASMGRINPRDMFYLATRNIAPAKAKKILIDGFLGNMKLKYA